MIMKRMAECEPVTHRFALVLVLVLARTVNGLRVVQLGYQDGQAQVFADTVAAFGSSGEDTVIELPRGRVFSLRNATIVSAQVRPGDTPFSSGTLTIQPAAGDSSEPTVLDGAMLYGIASVNGLPSRFYGATLRLQNLVLVNQCELPLSLDSANQIYSVTSETVAMFPRTRAYRSHQYVNVTQYVRHADVAFSLYSAAVIRTPFPKFAQLTAFLVADYAPTPITVASTTAYAMALAHFALAAQNATNYTYKSIADPGDPLLTSLKANGVMMEPRFCNGAAPPGAAPLAVYWDPALPSWLTADTWSWVDAMTQATVRLTQPPTAYLPPSIVCLSGLAVPASIRPISAMTPLEGPLLLSGPYCDVPGVPCEGGIDFSGIQGPFLPVTAGGLLFVHGLTLRGLSTQPLPSTATSSGTSAGGTLSVFPLSAFPLASGAEDIAMCNVTLVLPDLDYLAMLTLAQPSLSTCVNATVTDHATNLQAGITSLSLSSMETGYPSMVLATFVGWGLNASLLQLQPANPSLPYALLQACPQLLSSTATDQGSCSLSTRQVAIIAGCSVAGLVVLLAALLLGLLLVMRHHRPPSDVVQPLKAARTTNGMEAGTSAKSVKATGSIQSSDAQASSHMMKSGEQPQAQHPGQQQQQAGSAHAHTAPFLGLESCDAAATTAGALEAITALTVTAKVSDTISTSTASSTPADTSEPAPQGCVETSTSTGSVANGSALESIVSARDVRLTTKAAARELEPQHVQQLAEFCNRHVTKHAKEPASGKQLVLFLSRLPPVLPPALGGVEIVLQPEEAQPDVHASDGTVHSTSAQQGSDIVDTAVTSANPTQQAATPAHPKTVVQRLVTEMTSDNAEMVEVHGVLGQGSWGTVFKGTWRGLQVAIKTMAFQAQDEQAPGAAAPRVQRQSQAIMEAAVAASVDHKNLVRTYHYDIKEIITQERTDTQSIGGLQIDMSASHGGCKEFKLFLIQELCATSLSHVLHARALHDAVTGKVQQLSVVLDLLLDIAQGLEYLHSRNIVHGDLKPANVLLKPCAEGGNGVVAKLADFGLSARLGAEATHLSNYRSGTPFYVAPEVIHEHRTSTASDIFSFGVMTWQLYTGFLPYQSHEKGNYSWNPLFPNFSAPNIPSPALMILIHQCLLRDSRQRPTATTIIKRLTGLKARG